jgi:hypothetical protein
MPARATAAATTTASTTGTTGRTFNLHSASRHGTVFPRQVVFELVDRVPAMNEPPRVVTRVDLCAATDVAQGECYSKHAN